MNQSASQTKTRDRWNAREKSHDQWNRADGKLSTFICDEISGTKKNETHLCTFFVKIEGSQ